MHILFFSNLFPNPMEPERGVFSLQLVKALSDKVEVSVLCPLPWFPTSKHLKMFARYYRMGQVPETYQVEGIKVEVAKYPLIPKISESFHPYMIRKAVANKIHAIHRVKSIDIINSHWIYPDSVAIHPIASSLDIPHVSTALGCDINHDIFDNRKRRSILRTLHQVEAATVVSPDLKRICVEQGIDTRKINIILNGIDTNIFKQQDKKSCRKSLRLKQSERLLLYVGRLSKEKNLLRLVKAFSQLASRNDIDLHLVGDGPLRSDIVLLSRKLGLESRIHLHGNQPHRSISKWLGSADWFCLPSTREGCPNVVLEALACGIPVIASKVGAIPNLVNDESGILFDPLSTTAIAESISVAIKKTWDHNTISGSMNIFSWEQIASQYCSVFEKIISSKTISIIS